MARVLLAGRSAILGGRRGLRGVGNFFEGGWGQTLSGSPQVAPAPRSSRSSQRSQRAQAPAPPRRMSHALIPARRWRPRGLSAPGWPAGGRGRTARPALTIDEFRGLGGFEVADLRRQRLFTTEDGPRGSAAVIGAPRGAASARPPCPPNFPLPDFRCAWITYRVHRTPSAPHRRSSCAESLERGRRCQGGGLSVCAGGGTKREECRDAAPRARPRRGLVRVNSRIGWATGFR